MRGGVIAGVSSACLVAVLGCTKSTASHPDLDASPDVAYGTNDASSDAARGDLAPAHSTTVDRDASTSDGTSVEVGASPADAARVEVGASASDAASISPEDFFAGYVPARCARDVRCALTPDLRTCLDTTHASFAQIRADVNAGKISFDGVAAAACLDAVSKVSCNYSDRTPFDDAICNRVVVGAAAEGASCVINAECAGGNCDHSCYQATANACCLGKCGKPRLVLGPGDVCGAPFTKCAPDLYCAGVCRPRTPDGQPCASPDVCPIGHLCFGLTFMTMGTCQRKPADGKPCFDDGCDLDDDYCEPVTKLCTKRPRPGDPCDPTEGNDRCARFAQCDPSTKKCVELGRENQPCSGSCLGDLSCFGSCSAPREPPVCQ
jgi:hypothetical protein